MKLWRIVKPVIKILDLRSELILWICLTNDYI